MMNNATLTLQHIGSPVREIMTISHPQTWLAGNTTQTDDAAKKAAGFAGYNDHLNRAGLGFWRFSFADQVVKFCPVSCLMTQVKGSESLASLQRLLYAAKQSDLFREINALAQTGNGFEQEVKLMDSNGGWKWFRLTGILEQATDGENVITGTLLDITAFKLEEARKSDLMDFLCHELKSPLSTLRLYIQLTGKNIRNLMPDWPSDDMAKADQQVTLMNNLVNQYLNLSIARNRPDVQAECFDMVELVYHTVSQFAALNTDHVFKMDLSHQLLVTGNSTQLVQVMNNMMSNAVKFSPKHGFIKVSIRKKGNHILFSVLDQGIGIAAADVRQLFSKRFRANHSRTGTIEGHGLGLYLSKGIIEAHGGKVFVESEPGKGSIFGFTIPLKHTN